jgi:hypothetical protein
MKQIPHLTYGEQFALDEWLSDYPETMAYEDILLTLTTGDEDNEITVWAAMKDHPLSHVAGFIDDTRLHFERVVGSTLHD